MRQLALIRQARLPISVALVTGSTVALATALAPPISLGVEPAVVASLAPKSATAAVAGASPSGWAGWPAWRR